ncbi:MAG TPA: penicillin-binding protein 2 [Gammaproteobacteria bacterium]|jgi:penicillin-binding protein 2|nr:penicillin-binding protein 2 [Gammaproteobacteria bacterium]
MPRIRIRNEWLEQHLFRVRALVVGLIALLLFMVVMGRLVYLQIVNYSHFVTLSEGNRLHAEPVTPPRGLIFDRNGVPLAENRPSYELDVVTEQVPDLKATLDALGKVVELRPGDLKRFNVLLKSKHPFQPLPLRTELTDEEIGRFASQRQDFPGVDIKATLSRFYPQGELTAHVVGYVGLVNPDELQHLDPEQYISTSEVGKIGVEYAYEKQLHGSVGVRQMEVTAEGRPVNKGPYTPPVPGSDLYLSIDVKLQAVAEHALGDNNGAVVAIDPNTGEILALVSKPEYDPNLFIGGIENEEYELLQKDPSQPLFNRALRGQYPPGSTIKPFLGLAALNYNVVNPFANLMCPGYFYLPSNPNPYRDWRKGGHGETNLTKAIAESCDVYFYTVSLKLGIDRVHEFLTGFGLGQPPGVDLGGALPGLIPSPEWKRRATRQPWYQGDTVNIGIGQGYMLATPLQLAEATAALSVHGQRFAPHVLHSVGDPLSGVISDTTPQALPSVVVNTPGAWDLIIKAMTQVVSYGTAVRISYGAKYTIAGKTGTAQVHAKRLGVFGEEDQSGVPKELRDHALFIAFAPAQQPRIAVAVLVEHGGGGGAVAAPVARQVMDAYLLNQGIEAPPKP